MVAAEATPARAKSRANGARPGPAPAFGPGGRTPAAATPAAGDSGWWELDSSEAIPAVVARPGAGPARPTAAAAPGWQNLKPDDSGEGPVVTAKPVRPRWVTYAAIAGGVVAGVVAFSVAFMLVSRALGPGSPRAPEQAKSQEPPTAPPVAVADAPEPSPGSAPAPQPSGPVDHHREAVDNLVRAYNDIADGYARIRDASSIPEGNGPITRAVEQLRSAAQRGRGLPPLSPEDREVVIRHGGPPLLGAIDRLLGELRRLKATPGLRSDFDRLIEAYSRARQEIRREIEHR
jgi:hypothetical protein